MNFNNNDETRKSFKNALPILNTINNNFDKISNNKFISPNFRIYTNNNFKKTDKAYVTLVILNEDYLPGALILGYSLRKYLNNYNLICLVQDKPEYKNINGIDTYFSGVSKNSINNLLSIFDIIYGIDLLQINFKTHHLHFTETIKHYGNISLYVTKSYIFGITNYSQILYLDASTVVQKNLDYLFNEHKTNAFLYDSSITKTNMGIHGAVIIIKPSKKYYTKSLFLINFYNKLFGNLFFKRGIDEVILFFTVYPEWSSKLIKIWTRCTEDYAFKKCPIYHYQIHKPFKQSINKMNNKYTFKIWDNLAKEFIYKYPTLKNYFIHIKNLRNITYL